MRDLIALGALVLVLLAPVVLYYLPTSKLTQYIVIGIVSAAFLVFCFLSA